MKKLTVLYLRDNMFSGLIPRFLAMLSSCVVIDLQNNNFIKIEGAADGTFCGDPSPSTLPPAFKGSACAPVPDYPNQPVDTCCMDGNPLQGVTPSCLVHCRPSTSNMTCVGASVNLNGNDCANWAFTVRSSAYFTKASPPACQEGIHLSDPCSCTGVIGCSGGRITSVAITGRSLAFNATDESSLGLLDGLQHVDVSSNDLIGPVPEWVLNLTSLNFV
jgi:hypothetical protein